MTIQELEKMQFSFYDVRDQLKRHIYGRSEHAFAAGDAARDAITTRRALRRRQRFIRSFLLRCLGGLPAGKPNLRARTVGIVEGRGFKIEKVIFESRPKHFVTANLYLPDDLRGRQAAVLFLCGHHEQAKHVDEYQTVCQILVQAGLIVLAQDPIGQGERLSYYEKRRKGTTVPWGTFEHDYAGAQCALLGDSIARYFLHDAMRGVDYLVGRPEVDRRRIGVTGNSGGGTQTSLMMMADPRIAAAAPATFIMNRHSYMLAGGAQDAEQIWPGFTAAGLDHEDILLAMAPKPVRVLAVTSDYFPIEGVRRTVSRCKRIWELCGAGENLDLVEDNATHMYTPKLARAAADFFSLHLLGKVPETRVSRPISVFPPSSLWCTKSGQVRGELKGARFVHEANVERLAKLECARKKRSPARRHDDALRWLRRRVFSHRKPVELNPRFYWADTVEGMAAEAAIWWSQENIFNHALLFRASERQGQMLPVTLAVWDGGTKVLERHAEWIRAQCIAGRAVMVLDVTGAGALVPNSLTPVPPQEFYGVIHKFADDLTWLDDDLAALRVFDVIRALDMIETWPGIDVSDIECYAQGKHGVYAQLAAALDKRVRHIEVADGLGSFAALVRARHYDCFDIKSVVLRGVLRHFDLSDLKKWQQASSCIGQAK